MKTLIVYFSLTGHTERFVHELEGDFVELKVDKKMPKTKFFQIAKLGYYIARGKSVDLVDPQLDLSEYEKIVIGGQVWAGKISLPIQEFTKLYKDQLQNKKVDFYLTSGDTNENAEELVKQLVDESNEVTLKVRTNKEDK